MLYSAGHRRSTVLIQRQNSSRQGSRQGSRQSTPSRSPSAQGHTSEQHYPLQNSPFFVETTSTPKRSSIRQSFQHLIPAVNGLQHMSLAAVCSPTNKKRDKKTKSSIAVVQDLNARCIAKKKKAQVVVNPKDHVLAERERVDEIKEYIDSNQFDAAMTLLMSDTDSDFHYFNQVKSEALGEEHSKAFARRHGKLQDFSERPVPVKVPKICVWAGVNDFGHPLRCHNKCLYLCLEEHQKPLDFCVYHVKYCVNADHHTIPAKICIPNDEALCNECFVLRNHGTKPKALLRIPGTRRKPKNIEGNNDVHSYK